LITLSWEKLSIPFKVEVDYLKQQFDAFVTESQQPRSFTSQSLDIAASWTLQNDYQLEKGLEWATTATSPKFPGDPTSFPALSTKAMILDKLGRHDESAAVIKVALPFGSVGQLQQLGRQLLAANNPKLAFEVFKFNYDKDPDQFAALLGMARGSAANGDHAKALEFAIRALPLAPNDADKQAVRAMIEKLKAGKDIN
jgi:tetratricopeptide (TPR) repeat protein